MNKNLGTLIALGLDLEKFWRMDISLWEIQLRAYYTEELHAYVLLKGFEEYDYIYANNPNQFEFKIDNCKILLSKNA